MDLFSNNKTYSLDLINETVHALVSDLFVPLNFTVIDMRTDSLLRWLPLGLLYIPLSRIGVVGLGSATDVHWNVTSLVKDMNKDGDMMKHHKRSVWYKLQSWRGACCYKAKLSLLAELCGKPSMETLPVWWLESQIFNFMIEHKLTKLTAQELKECFQNKGKFPLHLWKF
jgi:hypothetical protein